MIITNGCRAGKRYMLPSACALPAAGGQSDALQSGRNVVHYMGIITIHPKGGRGFGDRGKTPAAGRQRLPGVLFLFHRAVSGAAGGECGCPHPLGRQ